ncbi:beta-propeller domain-containing protein [Candidatus Pacearchaeota archaeon]|nr:beta-propeller domain-containing protein [Candidatus Pacearchaeota archaeon]
MDDKFILMGLNDKRSKKIAEVLGNKTCKKIIDYLAETKQASEKDIADALNIPINTTEYNLKKLLETGLVEKTKNFFWSKKGKKIPMYKLAKKHIVISPKSKPTIDTLKTIIPVIAAIAFLVILISLMIPQQGIIDEDQTEIKTFSSYSQLEKFLEENQEQIDSYGGLRGGEIMAEATFASGTDSVTGSTQESKSASDYSETNIQVKGVDEPDIVKNDGKYIYAVSGSKVIIVNAYPAEDMEILSEINVSNIRNIFLNNNKLIIFSNNYKGGQKTDIKIYDVTDKEFPELEKEISTDGYYVNARMINDYVYVIANQHVGFDNIVLPGIMVDGIKEEIAVNKISYFNYPDTSYTFTNILAINSQDLEFESKTFLTGASHNIYVSQENIYLTYTKRVKSNNYLEEMVDEVMKPIVPREQRREIKEIMDSEKSLNEKYNEVSNLVQEYSMSLTEKEKAEFDQELFEKMQEFMIEIQKKTEKTVVHKINIDENNIEYITAGEVPGTVLNQFSMDEYDNNFRIATTTGDSWSDNSLNHLYVLDSNLEIIGSVDDLAKGEKIYSARFLGEKAYMVTFKKVDPLFVIDLSDPENPEVLGQLKVTGYSSYLHPYDENHIIGIGKEATEQGRIQGVKIALFDVSDVENPIEKAKYEVKGRWSNSNALYDHKAFLFDKDRELLVLPMSYSEEWTNTEGVRKYEHWQGSFVFKINQDTIELKGKIDHKENTTEQGYYYGPYAVQRSLYMDDTLYTISRTMIKANDLEDLSEINKVKLPYEDVYYYRGGIVGVEEVEVDE